MVSFGSQVDFSVPHLKIRGLNKFYDVQGQRLHALKEINLDIPTGQVVGIIGKSGAGKSSLLRTLNGLESIDTGSILIHQHNIAELSHAELIKTRQKIGMIFQHFNLMSAKTVSENVALPLRIAGYEKAAIEQRVNEVLSLVGLQDKLHDYPAQLSGGQKQRVGIARALVSHPEILLCDEATSALDPESTANILALLKQINRDLGLTIVLITHEMQVIQEICDQVVVIDQGEIVESGQVWSVFSNPQQQITQELLNLEQLNLPFELSKTIDQHSTHQILKLKYVSESKSVPDLYELLNFFNSPVQVYHSQIGTIQQHTIGSFVIGISNLELDVKNISTKQHHAITQLEVIGYAKPTH
ncbi:methionine ABC transporter ATP-binding protein [Acinetobacter sp. NIPH 2699]|uniref:methionine ABC transporter ATP-binding protein n=1 Tax=Acinetobacter sp. NIPH 2699 TaxID=2923433 RepID=UPI001F4AFAB0|nr:methionine ABC transporter ATP-binding protein [Acinetobacter sp. NIPH 2699]MCH7335276.1 methionine ABC transporter ATP-binding protein [Acinetobacter sp. NIPH 2699]